MQGDLYTEMLVAEQEGNKNLNIVFDMIIY
mgnify:CR=1 FL=1